MSKVIRRDRLTRYRAWKPPAVEAPGGADAGAVRAPTSEHPNLLTASQIEALQQQAYNEAYEQGLKEGREAARNELETRVQRLDKLMQALSEPFQMLDDQVEEEIVALVQALVRQLVRREIRTDPGQVVAVVREAMGLLPAATRNARLHLHPEDAALVREALSLSEDERTWSIVEDPVLARGGCQVVTENSQIDASVETRLNQLIATVFGGERGSDE